MDLRFPAGVLAMVIVAGAASACVPDTGSVVVQVRDMAPSAPGNAYAVTVFGPEGDSLASREVSKGSSITIDDVPLGWVDVEAASACTVGAELSSQFPTMRLVIDDKGCTLTK